MKDLEHILHVMASATHNIAYTDANEGYTQELKDAAELIRVLARLLGGKSVHEAFGAPGDWGYEHPVGRAILEVYRQNGGSAKLVNST